MSSFACDNVYKLPKLTKVVLSPGFNATRIELAAAKLVQTDVGFNSGPKPRKSVAGFKVRGGQLIALEATLRSVCMFEFLDRLMHIALPKLREFRGLNVSAFDNRHNISFGVKEYSVFPEIKYNKSAGAFGVNIALCIRAASGLYAIALLTFLGIPFGAIV
ncbi:50S ribosomal protein L5 [Candidatus Hodgkinia cicadicola]|nr:50S ribosomal protein L5 [Candidatus Hodgkinia cicadicola]